MPRPVEALRARGLAAEIGLAGRWVECRGECCRDYVSVAARGGSSYIWCDDPGARTVESDPNPDAAVAAAPRRAARAAARRAGPRRR